MAKQDYGYSLNPQIVQPGWSVQSDGFGLITSTTTFKCDHTVNVASFAGRGMSHPDTAYSYLKAHKYTISWDSLKIATVKVDYVGIDPTVNSGNITNPNCAAANGLTSQSITAHPNFFNVQAGYLGAIAGPAPYTQDSPNHYAPNVNGQPAYLGLNGSCFETINGGRFIGFVDPTYPQYYGKTQYLAPTTSYSGIVYLDNVSQVQVLVELLGTTSLTDSWSTFKLLPSWAPVGTGYIGNPVNLLSQVNVEEFGSLYKVSYEIRYSKDGWELDVYKKI